MTISDLPRCVRIVHDKSGFGRDSHQCKRVGVITAQNGNCYCVQHDPYRGVAQRRAAQAIRDAEDHRTRARQQATTDAVILTKRLALMDTGYGIDVNQAHELIAQARDIIVRLELNT